MTRITESQVLRNTIDLIQKSRSDVVKYSQEASSGIAVAKPGDDPTLAPAIADMRETVRRYDKHKLRIETARGVLGLQSDIMTQANDIMVRAKELATQGANETLGPSVRAQMAAEVLELRNAIVGMANTKYQGRYIYGGAADSTAPYNPDVVPYTNSTSAEAAKRYSYTTSIGNDSIRSVYVTDSTKVDVNTPGNQVFDNAIHALEILGRSLEGFKSSTVGGVPDGGGIAYDFSTETSVQTQDILSTIDLIEASRTNDLQNEQVTVAGRLARIDNSVSILDSLQLNLNEVLSRTQGADVFDSATNLNQAQNALETSLAVSGKVLQISLLDYL
ncbi:MAG: hypothetical protein SGJ02_11250 [bacterium]|nr:hypothetical protein [bacterium]